MNGYQRPRPSAAATRRRLEGDKVAFEAQAAVHRRLMDLLEDELADARSAGIAVAIDVLEDEVARHAGLEQEMQSSADHADMALAALAAKVAG